MWRCGTRLVLPSVTEAVRSFVTLGNANLLTQQRATEDVSQQNWRETLNTTLDYCTMCSLQFESWTFTQCSLSHTHRDIFFFVCYCFSVINELSFVLNIVYENQEVPLCVCLACVCVTSCMRHPHHHYCLFSNCCPCMVGHILHNMSCPPQLIKYCIPFSVKWLSH